jgi:hypothetical protein
VHVSSEWASLWRGVPAASTAVVIPVDFAAGASYSRDRVRVCAGVRAVQGASPANGTLIQDR